MSKKHTVLTFYCGFLVKKKDFDYRLRKGLSINYVDKDVGLKSARFSALGQTLFSSEPS